MNYFSKSYGTTTNVDTVAKFNFSSWNYSKQGWVNLNSNTLLPANLDNGVSIFLGGGSFEEDTLGMTGSMFPDSVGMTYCWLSSNDDNSVVFEVSGLEPSLRYNFGIYASVSDEDSITDRTTTYSIIEPDMNISGSLNPVGNRQQILE